jgi:hypothetical protein
MNTHDILCIFSVKVWYRIEVLNPPSKKTFSKIRAQTPTATLLVNTRKKQNQP